MWVTRLFFIAESRDPLTSLCKNWALSKMANTPKHSKMKMTREPLAQTHCGSAPATHPPISSIQGSAEDTGWEGCAKDLKCISWQDTESGFNSVCLQTLRPKNVAFWNINFNKEGDSFVSCEGASARTASETACGCWMFSNVNLIAGCSPCGR